MISLTCLSVQWTDFDGSISESSLCHRKDIYLYKDGSVVNIQKLVKSVDVVNCQDCLSIILEKYRK